MTNEDLALSVQRGNQGDFPALWGQVQRLARRIANRYVPLVQPSDVEDLHQLAALGVWDACRTFDPLHGSFSNWMAYYIKQRIRRELLRPRVQTVSLDAPLSEDGEGTLLDVTPDESAEDPQTAAERTDLAQRVREAVARLPLHERRIVTLCDLNGLSFDEAAAEEAVPAQHIKQRRVNAFRHLRQDPRLRLLRPDSMLHVSVATFRNTWTSSTELLAMKGVHAHE